MDQPSPEIPLTVEELDPEQVTRATDKKSSKHIGLIIVGILLLIAIIAGFAALAASSTDTTARVRDIFIIFMALESLVIGAALIILIVQLAILINLLNNEVRPIIKSTNQTVNTLRGTVQFLSDNLSDPVIKMNEILAGMRKFFDIIRPGRN